MMGSMPGCIAPKLNGMTGDLNEHIDALCNFVYIDFIRGEPDEAQGHHKKAHSKWFSA